MHVSNTRLFRMDPYQKLINNWCHWKTVLKKQLTNLYCCFSTFSKCKLDD